MKRVLSEVKHLEGNINIYNHVNLVLHQIVNNIYSIVPELNEVLHVCITIHAL